MPGTRSLRQDIDPRRTEQVLDNLLTNAIKYSPQGGPVSVTVEADVVAQTVEIRVKDAGIGIPQHQQAQIFGRFMRADNARAAGISGTGLGLYLCRVLVEQQDGQLWFESRRRSGIDLLSGFSTPVKQSHVERAALTFFLPQLSW